MKLSKLSTSLLLAAVFAATAVSARAAAGAVSDYSLRIIQSPRLAGMGETGAALWGEVLGAYEANPAALANSYYKEAAITYSSWIEDISLQKVAYVHPLGKIGVVGGMASLLQIKSFAGYDATAYPTGDISASDFVGGLAYARRVSGPWDDNRKGIFAGGVVKYVKQKLDTVSASGILFDGGIQSITPFGPGLLGLGASFQSFGSKFKFDRDADPPPTLYRFGGSYNTLLWGDPLILTADVVKPREDSMSVHAGMELILWRALAWRMGYISGQDMGSGLRFGAGFDFKLFKLDYALASFGDFGLTHRMAVSMKFGKPVEITPHLSPAEEKARWHYGRAEAMIAQSRYYEAIMELDEALKLDPNYKEAVQLMSRARNLMETQK